MAPDIFRVLVQSELSNLPVTCDVYTNDICHGLCFPTVNMLTYIMP